MRAAVVQRLVCAWCGRVRTSPRGWQPLAKDEPLALATHGICPDCLARETRAAGTASAALPLTADEGR